MSTDIPISDALCEAMEYLCKLGTNLRVRSESLKEKRIRKDKLRNSHAVQKAADKVLLICELSKKSLENVESGVRRVLSQITERSVMKPVTSISKKSEDANDVQYFQYQSLKLRVCKKVPVKLYLSAKVLARKMPLSMQQKYPVYYNCKLYRQRKREEKVHDSNKSLKKSLKSVSENDTEKIETKKQDVVDVDSDSSKMLTTRKIENNDDSPEKSEDNNSENNTVSHIMRKRHKRKSSTLSNTQTKKYKNIKPIDDSSDNSNEDTDEGKELKKHLNKNEDLQSTHLTSDLNSHILESDHNKKETESNLIPTKMGNIENNLNMDSVNSHLLNDARKVSPCNIQQDDPSKIAKSVEKYETDILDISSKVNDDEQSSSIPAAQEKQSCEYDVKEVPENKNVNVIERKKNKSDKVTDQHESLENSNKENDTVLKEQNEFVDKSIVRKSKDEVFDYDEKKLKSSENKVEPDNIISQPLIKCVNINKLLKQDHSNTNNKTVIKNNSDATIKTTLKNTTKEVKTKRKLSKKSSSDSDEDYWRQKRNEIKAFKPKKFTVAIHRLPKYTNNFLLENSLRKIVHKDSIIFELQKSTKDDERILENNINSVKNALMNDSESDKSDSEQISTANLVCSQNDKETNDQDKTVTEIVNEEEIASNNNDSNTEELKQALLYESDSDGPGKSTEDNSKDLNYLKKAAEQVKNDLLNDSNSDNSKNNDLPETNIPEREKTPVKEVSADNVNDCNKSEVDETPRSKRKRIMESMKAKKMLLTYSSSDTEDEQLVNALKEIKDELLKGFSSDENNGKEEGKEKQSSSSESEENIIGKIKQQKEDKKALRKKHKMIEVSNEKVKL